MLSGDVDNWSAFGGADEPIRLLVAQEIAPRLRRILQLPDDVGADVPVAALVEDVRSAPGALALVPLAALRPGLLPLVVDGYDPLRDPAAVNPLGLRRWLRAPDDATRDAVLAALGWTPLPASDPLSLVATGDYIPGALRAGLRAALRRRRLQRRLRGPGRPPARGRRGGRLDGGAGRAAGARQPLPADAGALGPGGGRRGAGGGRRRRRHAGRQSRRRLLRRVRPHPRRAAHDRRPGGGRDRACRHGREPRRRAPAGPDRARRHPPRRALV